MTTITRYEYKEDKTINRIVDIMYNLDNELNTIDNLESSNTTSRKKEWRAEKKALHNVKRILHEVNLYDNYTDKEEQIYEKDMEKIMAN